MNISMGGMKYLRGCCLRLHHCMKNPTGQLGLERRFGKGIVCISLINNAAPVEAEAILQSFSEVFPRKLYSQNCTRTNQTIIGIGIALHLQ